jgi:predicted Zn-dependent peptidase
MSRLGRSLLLLGRILSPDEVSRRIDQVTAESVITLARRVLDLERVALASVGPESLPTEAELRGALNGAAG